MARGEWDRPDKRRTVERALGLDIRLLARDGKLQPGRRLDIFWNWASFDAGISVQMHNDEMVTVFYSADGKPSIELISVTWTEPHFGGRRPWWLCPDCDRRAALVYLTVTDHFTCRRCAGLTYMTSQVSRPTRAMRRSNEKALALGWYLGEPFPNKPPRMHRSTWKRQIDDYGRAARTAHTAFAPVLERWAIEAAKVAKEGRP